MKKRTACPHCKKTFQAKLELQGKKIRCPNCKTGFVISFEDQPAPVSPKPTAQTALPVATAVEAAPVIPVAPIVEAAPVVPVAPVVEAKPVVPVAPVVQPVAPVAQVAPTAPPAKIDSPFESLATQHMAGGSAQLITTNLGAATDKYLLVNRKLRRTEEHEELDERAMKLVAKGAALMLFGILITALGFIGIHMSDLDHICPIGAFLGTVFGIVGGIMVMVGLLKRIPYAILLGGFPGMFFAAASCGVVYLSFQGYWNTHPFPFLNTNGRNVANTSPNNSSGSSASRNDSSQNDSSQNDSSRNGPSKNGRPNSSSSAAPRTGFSFPQAGSPSSRSSRSTFPGSTSPTSNRSNSKPTNRSDNNSFSSLPGRNADPEPSAFAPAKKRTSSVPFISHDGFLKIDWSTTQRKFSRRYTSAFGRQSLHKFPAKYLSKAAGKSEVTFGDYIAHPEKLPVVGLNVMQSPSSSCAYEAMPVFSRSESATSMAKPGYALGGLYVSTSGNKVRGIRCVFVRSKNGKPDTSDIDYGEWMGKPPSSGNGEFISGDGRNVFGIWFDSTGFDMTTLGLIRESE